MTASTKTLPWLVDIALPVPLRQTFTYRLGTSDSPAEVKKGYRALVPFGPRLMHGITMGAPYQTDTPPKRLRSVVKIDTQQRVLSEEITKLVEWMAQYYRSPIGEIVKLALPPGVLEKPTLCYQLTERGKAAIDQDADARILALLDPFPLTKPAWEMKAQAQISQTQIRQFEEAGFVEILTQRPTKAAIPQATAYSLTDRGKTLDLAVLKNAPKQQKLFQWLREQTQPHIAKSQILQHFKNTSSLLKALEEKGFLEKQQIAKHKLFWTGVFQENVSSFTLTDEQHHAITNIQKALEQPNYQPFLMFGVTGSGKTEVYLRAISACLTQGRQALFLVPEISLTPLMQKRIVDRFGERLAILHSAVGKTERSEAWARVLAGKVEVVLGARSGIFAPLPRLGLIIVDEEHDTSYKQHDGVRYQARDLALVRAKMAQATVILGSATPSLESWHNYQKGRFTLLEMAHRATRAPLPKVAIVDMRKEFQEQRKRVLFSRELLEKLQQSLEANQQAMILLNRRGYHSFLLCRKCGETMQCTQCEVSLTFHRADRFLKCHYCEETRPIPQDCCHCGAPAAMMQFFGEGTQQIQEALQKKFPQVAIDRLDRDQLTRKDAMRNILKKFELGETQILVGTQMIAKGHDFPNVTTVGIINADQGLRMPDFRCAEHAFQLITQVAGRSGRGTSPGSVVIQTYMPEHYSVQSAAKHDFPAFLEKELRYRRNLFYPPFSHAVHLLVQEKSSDKAWQAIQWIMAGLQSSPQAKSLTILGPTKAPVAKIKNIYRFQLLLKAENRSLLHYLIDQVVEAAITQKVANRSAIILDIDPYQFS